MAEAWCKVSSGLARHPKVRKAGNLGRQVYEHALRMNADPGNPIPGTVRGSHMEDWFIADELQMSVTDAVTGLKATLDVGLIRKDGDAYYIVGWDDWWSRGGAKTNSERQHEWRQRKARNGEVTANVTRNESNAIRVEKKREEERRGEEIGERASAPEAKPAKARAVVMPEGWEPDPPKAPEGVDPASEFVQFRDHHAARASRFVDWNAAFRTWLRNAAKFQSGRGGRSPPGKTPFDLQMERVAMLEERERQEALSLDVGAP